MKVLVATNQTQGERENDFCWTVEGELVFFPPRECGRGYVDDNCGCRRSMAGVVSRRATTTVKVVEREDLDPPTYYRLIEEAMESQGYVTKELAADPEVQEWLLETALELRSFAKHFPAGTVLERRDDILWVRCDDAA